MKRDVVGLMLLVWAAIVLTVTVLAFCNSLYTIATQDPEANSELGAQGYQLGSAVGAVIRTIIGLSVAGVSFYFATIRFNDPERHSGIDKIRKIVTATSAIETTDIRSPNFYTNSANQELAFFFEQPRVKGDEMKLKQLVFEARNRLDRHQRTAN